MKQILTLLLAVCVCIGLMACGAKEEAVEAPTTEAATEAATEATPADIYFEVGKEMVVNNFTFTVTEIGFADSICIEKGDSIGMYSKTGDSVKADEGYGWLYYSVEYKPTGTEELPAQAQFLPTVQYQDHYFSFPNLRFFKYDGQWHGLDYQWGDGTSLGLPLPATDMLYKYDPWVEKEYTLHGAIQVATKAVEDTANPLILHLFLDMGEGAPDRVKCEVTMEPPAEATEADRLLTFSYEDREFFKTYVQELTPMTEDEIRAVLTGKTFKMRNNYGGDGDGTHTISFLDGGQLDARYTFDGEEFTMYDAWRIESGNVIVVTPGGEEKILTPYQFDATRYLLMHMEERGDYSMVLTVTE